MNKTKSLADDRKQVLELIRLSRECEARNNAPEIVIKVSKLGSEILQKMNMRFLQLSEARPAPGAIPQPVERSSDALVPFGENGDCLTCGLMPKDHWKVKHEFRGKNG